MKTDNHKFLPFDDVADSMTAAASRLGVPLEAVKMAKRAGCDAFKGSRVNLGRLQKFFTTQATRAQPTLSELLLCVVKDVAHVISEKLPLHDTEFREESGRMTEQIHLGFALALAVVEPDRADWFLKRSAVLMESIFTIRKKPSTRSNSSNER